MRLKGLIDEDFTNYKKPSMFIIFPTCNFKCERECGVHCCQNSELAQAPTIEITINNLIDRYLDNPITSAIVCGGLEPLDSWEELQCFIMNLRYRTCDDLIIYTGYEEHEVQDKIQILQLYENIIVKFGRYVPNQKEHYDELIGVTLASNNQYAKRISE